MAQALNVLSRNFALSSLQRQMKVLKCNNLLLTQVRTLYAPITLGITAYVEQRQRTQNQLKNITEKFKEKMRDYTADDSKSMIFTEDLKNMVYIAEETDVELVIKMMKRFNSQNKELRFGNYIFGPVIMRFFHHLNRPDEALAVFKSPDFDGLFDQLITYQLLMDMLYENKRYSDIFDVFEIIKDRQIEGTKYPKNIVVLLMASCYKLNTPDSYKYASDLWQQLQEVGHFPMRRAVTFYAGLALNQGHPEACMEIISSSKNQNYTTIRNLRIASYAKVGRLDEVILSIKGVLGTDDNTKQTFNPDVLESVKGIIEKDGNTEVKHEFTKIMEYLKDNGHISDTTLDEQLCQEIQPPAFVQNKVRQQTQFRFKGYDKPGKNKKYTFGPDRRPGLSDMQ